MEREKEWRKEKFKKRIEGLRKEFSRGRRKGSRRSNKKRRKEGTRKSTFSYYVPHDKKDEEDVLGYAHKFVEGITSIATNNEIEMTDAMLSRIESMALLALQIYESTNIRQALYAVLQFLKTYTDKSLCSTVSRFITNLFNEKELFDVDTSDDSNDFSKYEPHVHRVSPDWLVMMRQISTNWKAFVNNYAFKRMSTLISIMISLGLCDEASFKWDVNGVRLFSIEAYKLHTNAFDLIDAIMDTTMYFVENGYECFRTGSIKPMLYSDLRAKNFEEDYYKLVANLEHVRTGNLRKYASMDENEYDKILSDCLQTCKDLMQSAKSLWEKKIFADRFRQLNSIKSTFDAIRVQGGLRKAPYANLFYGKSGVGKSTISAISMIVGLHANGCRCTDDVLVTHKESDKFMSNYKSHVNGMFIDDIGNTKPDFVEKAPTDTIIEICNNVRMYANMAEADLKGKISVEPYFVNFTSNVKSMNAHTYSNEPVSIARRAHNTITVKVKPEYCKVSYRGISGEQLDSDKVRAKFEKDGKLPPICDIWSLTVEKVVPTVRGPTSVDLIGYETVVFEGKKMEDIDIYTFLRYMIKDSRNHFAAQEVLVDSQNNMCNKITWCSSCKCPVEICMCGENQEEFLDCVSTTSSEPKSQTVLPENGCPVHGKRGEFVESCGLCQKYKQEDPIDDGDCKLTYGYTECGCKQCHDLWLKDRNYAAYAPHFGMIAAYSLYKKKVEYERWFDSLRQTNTDPFERMLTKELMDRIQDLEESKYFQWTNWVPIKALNNKYGKMLIDYAYQDKIYRDVKYKITWLYIKMLFCFVCGALSYPLNPFLTLFWGLTVIHYLTQRSVIINVSKEKLYEEIERRSDAMPEVFKKYRDKHGLVLLKMFGAAAGLYLVFRIWKSTRDVERQMKAKQTDEHGVLNPESKEEVEKYDSAPNEWAKYPITELPYNDKKQYTSSDAHMKTILAKNLVHIFVPEGNRTKHCCAFFIKSNLMLLPRHMWYHEHAKEPEKDMLVTIKRAPDVVDVHGDKQHNKFSFNISLNCTYFIPNTDLSLVWAPAAGSYKDLSMYLPQQIKQCPVKMYYRDEKGEVIDAYTTIRPGDVGHSFINNFKGSSYTLSIEPKNGMCMSPLVSSSSLKQITGFHLGGKPGTHEGISGLLTIDEFRKAEEELGKKNLVVLGPSEGTFKTKQFGVDFYIGPQTHKKSPVNFMEGGSGMQVYGSVTGRVSPRSNVVQSCISDIVKDVTGVPQKWGPPHLWPEWKPYQESLKYSAHPPWGMEGELLEKAMLDYQEPLLELVKRDYINEYARPLTEVETVSGIDGIRFIDKMPANTSVGYPLKKPKKDFLTLLDPEEYPDQSNPVELDKQFWEEAKQCEQEYLEDRRCYFIFNACTKDEPTKLDKDKVRIFQSAPLVAQLLIRKYFLPMARVISLFPLVGECAVGINCQGPEWEILNQFVEQYGKDFINAGDYSKYDLRMWVKFIFVAFKILINMAIASGNYSDNHIKIMRGIAFDVCYPFMAYNGTLLSLIGSNPSGQNLTVYINSIVNSLLFRCGFFSMYSDVKFRDAVALMTYGDDAKSSVKDGYRKFNHLSFAKFLDEHDMKFTMPDKTSEPTAFMKSEDCDFLKRKSVYNPDVNMHFGALDENSIFKSLHAVLKSKHLSPQEQAICNIDGALREWFAHGKSVYELRRAQMREVCEKAQIRVDAVDLPYENRLVEWKRKYLNHYDMGDNSDAKSI